MIWVVVVLIACSGLIKYVKLSRKYKLNKLIPGLTEGNVGSQKILKRNGFILEGQRIKHLFYNGEYFNQLDYGLILST